MCRVIYFTVYISYSSFQLWVVLITYFDFATSMQNKLFSGCSLSTARNCDATENDTYWSKQGSFGLFVFLTFLYVSERYNAETGKTRFFKNSISFFSQPHLQHNDGKGEWALEQNENGNKHANARLRSRKRAASIDAAHLHFLVGVFVCVTAGRTEIEEEQESTGDADTHTHSQWLCAHSKQERAACERATFSHSIGHWRESKGSFVGSLVR